MYPSTPSSDPTPESVPDPNFPDRADYESTPVSRQEYVSAMVHLYRGELYRATQWRIRLDTTTNWAVITTAALLSLSFGEAAHSHWILLVGVALVAMFWVFESRRFRYCDMWYTRLRLIEENFYGPLLRRDPRSPERGWGETIADDLLHPSFKITRGQALRQRFVRNYWAIFAVLLFAWALKLFLSPVPADDWSQVQGRLAMGILPWWIPICYVSVLLTYFTGLIALVPPISRDHHHGTPSPPAPQF
ncbi:MAG: putative membrane protein [Planctomycetota bacterium]|jgi:uncharacterized membrane protein